MRHLVLTVLLLGSVPAFAAELQVIDDFEHGTYDWRLVEGVKPEGSGPLCVMSMSAAAKVGRTAACLHYAACPKTWTHVQCGIRTTDWIANDCDRISFWLKGDGSGEALNLMFGNYGIKPALCFRYGIKLDFTDWRQFVIPFNDFEPKGQMATKVGRLVLAQLNVSDTQKPIEIMVDDLVALPADRGDGPARFFPVIVPGKGSWSTRGPGEAIAVDNLRGVPADAAAPAYVHGVKNHPELHSPIAFFVEYPDDGRFGVKVGGTSGWGGSRLIIRIDGEEKLRRDFPGATQTTLTEFQGYYGVPVARGKHTIVVDNDGNDWFQVESYCFDNYGTGAARLRREDGRLEATISDSQGVPLQGISVAARVADAPCTLVQQADGTWLSDSLWDRFPLGLYPVDLTARRQAAVVYQASLSVKLGAARMRPLRAAYDVNAAVNVDLVYGSEGEVPLMGQHVRVSVAGHTVECAEQGNGVYRVELGRLEAGTYLGRAEVESGRSFEVPFLVYDPGARPWEAEGIIRLGPNGWFMTGDGKDYVPWGYATIGLFVPDPETPGRIAGPSAWCRATDQQILDWIGFLAACGINCVRFGVTVDAREIGGDRGGHADPEIVARLHRFLDLIGPMGVRAIPVMWWGHYRNFNYEGIPAYDALIETQADWFTKPEALALQQQYVREVVEPFKDDPRILAWEVMNETYRAGGDIQAAIRWTNEIVKTIRSVSPKHLVTTSAAEATPNPELAWVRDSTIDFFNFHVYPTYPDYDSYRKLAGDSPREVGNYTALMMLCDRTGPKVTILGETGNDRLREMDYPELRGLITRDALWLSFLNGSPGGISWDAIADAREFIVISGLAKRIDWRRFEPVPPPLVVRLADADAQVPELARYTWWSLETGVPIGFVADSASPATGQVLLPGSSFVPPPELPKAPVSVSQGFQAATLQSKDGQVFMAYVRNVSGPTRINVRVRATAPLTMTVCPPRAGTLEVWDLDLRTLAKSVPVSGETQIRLGETAHDVALFLAP